MSRVSVSTAGVLSLTTMLLAIGCGQETTGPADPGPISLLIVSGNGQSGVVGTELPQALVIKATKSNGAIIANLTVNFRVIAGGGSMFAGAAVTDSKGIAADYWTLGTLTAQQQRVEVRAVSSTGTKQVFGVFTATGLAGPAAQIAIQAGDGQTANASTSVPVPPAVLVRDQYGNTVPNLSVTFAVATGGGSVTGGNATTNTSGIATVGSWTLGSSPGANTLTGTALGSGIAGNPVIFTATAVVPWTTKASMPTSRERLGVTAINGILYAVGGDNNDIAALETVEAYDPASDLWTTKASMPTARRSLGVASINGILYAVGGIANTGVVATVEAYDPATNTWTTKAPMLTPRSGPGVVAINGVLYVVGGSTSCCGPVATVEAYDAATDTWTTRASMSTARHGPGVTAIDGVLYVVGGFSGFELLATVEAYDPATDTWTPKASMPTPRQALGIAVMNDTLYAIGGEHPVVATVEAYSRATNTWTTTESMPTARSRLGVAAINGILFAVGGINGADAVGTVEAYQP